MRVVDGAGEQRLHRVGHPAQLVPEGSQLGPGGPGADDRQAVEAGPPEGCLLAEVVGHGGQRRQDVARRALEALPSALQGGHGGGQVDPGERGQLADDAVEAAVQAHDSGQDRVLPRFGLCRLAVLRVDPARLFAGRRDRRGRRGRPVAGAGRGGLLVPHQPGRGGGWR